MAEQNTISMSTRDGGGMTLAEVEKLCSRARLVGATDDAMFRGRLGWHTEVRTLSVEIPLTRKEVSAKLNAEDWSVGRHDPD
jgi:hypothetical protein